MKTIKQISDDLQQGQYSSIELTQSLLDTLQTADAALNSFISITAEQALTSAKQADNQRSKGQATALTGIPIAHKDLFCTQGIKTSCASKMLDNFISPYDATVVKKLAEAGTVCLGKTNMDEFAMGSSNENSFYGPVKNPWNLEHVPGGSSGGSAAAVAAELVPATTGTDTGGSIRQPAAFCGITGIKPTYGRVSRYGMVAYASSLDQAGPLARTAEDCALLLQAMAGFDPLDSTSMDRAVDDYSATLNDSVEGLTIGLPKQFWRDETHADITAATEQAVKQLESMGAKVKTIDLPNVELSIPAYYVIAPAEASTNLSRFDGVRYGYRCQAPEDLEDMYKRSRAEAFGTEVKRRILIGTYALSAGYYDAYYLKAQKLRRLISEDYQAAFKQVDVIMGPTTPNPAFKLGEKTDDPVAMYLEDIFTISVNLAGLPGLSMPVGFTQGLPIGAQLIGPHFSEAKLLNIAHQFQQATDWHEQRPTSQTGESN